MPSDNALPWILGGSAAVVAVYFWQRGRDGDKARADHNAEPGPATHTDAGHAAVPKPTPSTQDGEPLPGRWVWPVGVWNGHKPEISDGYWSLRRQPEGYSMTHGGVDIMYRRRNSDPWKAGTPNGSPNFVMADHRAALAASDGVVWSAAKTARGWAVTIDHTPRKLATYYTHMSELLVTAKQSVTAGTPLGIIGADPLDGEHLMHLHFEVWRGGQADAFDPQKLMEATWEYLPDPGDLPRTVVARNGGHRPEDGSERTVPVITHYRRPARR